MSELKLPELGENIVQGTVTKILVKVGDSIKKGQNILELETDKAVLEVPSPSDCIIKDILIKAGTVVKVNQPIFNIEGSTPTPTGGHDFSRVPMPAAEQASPVIESTPGKHPSAAPSTITNVTTAQIATSVTTTTFDMNLPALGENIEKGTVTKVLVKVGDTLKKGQNILEIETDKAVLEVPSPADAVVKEILIKSGTVIKVGQPIFKVEGSSSPTQMPTGGHVPRESGYVSRAPASVRYEDPSTLPNDAGLNTKATQSPKPNAEPSTVTTVTTPPIPIRKDIPAAPSVRLLARELGIDIAQVPGSGKGGRIGIEDVKAYCKLLNTTRPSSGTLNTSSPTLPNFTKWGNVRLEPMSNVRKKTAEHLSNAWVSIPHVTQFDKVDITELEKLRKSMAGTKKISVTPFIIKVIAAALKKFPQFNASVDMASQEIIYKDYVNIGVAVDTDRGLIVPVLKNVDTMSILQINDELTALAERARLRKTSIEEMQGGCFTISNLGGIGGTHFTPIVNWPEVAILGVSRGSLEPVYTDGVFIPRLMLPLSLSYDHRQIDGADGARFLRFVCEAIQQPFLLDLNK